MHPCAADAGSHFRAFLSGIKLFKQYYSRVYLHGYLFSFILEVFIALSYMELLLVTTCEFVTKIDSNLAYFPT